MCTWYRYILCAICVPGTDITCALYVYLVHIYPLPYFTRTTVFRLSRPLQGSALSCRWLAGDCIVYYSTVGVTGDNSIVYDFCFLAARWTVHAKTDSFGSYRTYKIFGVTNPFDDLQWQKHIGVLLLKNSSIQEMSYRRKSPIDVFSRNP